MQIKYISWLPGVIGLDNEEIDTLSTPFSLENLMETLEKRKGRYETIFRHKNVIFASKNGKILKPTDLLENNDVITFFSPIAGG